MLCPEAYKPGKVAVLVCSHQACAHDGCHCPGCVPQVVSPNIFNFDLWKTSGHADHYRDNMFSFDVEKQEFGLKPMNCPGHCIMFGNKARSYR